MAHGMKRKRSGWYNDLSDLALSSIVLPKEIHLEILSWVPFEDIEAVSQSCKFWNVIRKSQLFWNLFATKHKSPYQENWTPKDWKMHLIHRKLKAFIQRNSQIVAFTTFLDLIDGDIVFALELLQLLDEDISRCLSDVSSNKEGKRCGFPPYRCIFAENFEVIASDASSVGAIALRKIAQDACHYFPTSMQTCRDYYEALIRIEAAETAARNFIRVTTALCQVLQRVKLSLDNATSYKKFISRLIM